mmetsp:Transcript_10356/g.33448  ORF Transcript_10356/g.33448 Transcript_10356/m.33448 type:complete len:207 (+) Transcript_10356:646-1266(+)
MGAGQSTLRSCERDSFGFQLAALFFAAAPRASLTRAAARAASAVASRRCAASPEAATAGRAPADDPPTGTSMATRRAALPTFTPTAAPPTRLEPSGAESILTGCGAGCAATTLLPCPCVLLPAGARDSEGMVPSGTSIACLCESTSARSSLMIWESPMSIRTWKAPAHTMASTATAITTYFILRQANSDRPKYAFDGGTTPYSISA